jgi:hypothetical protein
MPTKITTTVQATNPNITGCQFDTLSVLPHTILEPVCTELQINKAVSMNSNRFHQNAGWSRSLELVITVRAQYYLFL